MASLIGSAVGSGANQNMQNGWGQLQAYADPGNLFGGNSAQAMDPIGYGIANLFGVKSPLEMITDKIPGFQPNPQNNAGGVPSVLPNLGPQSMIPQMPQGNFMPQMLGQGPFNMMAGMSAGPTWNPSAKGAMQSQQPIQQPMISSPMHSLGNMAGGGGYGRGFQAR